MVKPTQTHVSKYLVDKDCLIEEGSTGKVFMAQNKFTQEFVAIKSVDLHLASFDNAFTNETKILSKTKNLESVINMKECFIYQNRGYIVMDLMTEDLFNRSESLESMDDIKYIFLQVCQAVQDLHNMHISHLDLKPENILLSIDDSIKLCDFGSSVMWNIDDTCNKVIGSEYYIAPEILRGGSYSSTKADIWSLGVILYLLVTGNFPYGGNSEFDIHSNYLKGNTNLESSKGYIDEDCYELLSKMLSKDPESRPSIKKVLQDKFFCISNEMEWELSY
mmetsp:Transcript_11000/g.18746  ORF Transcript_11000/g.18746 Transcript_11000/m.18746 type:complete len:277 (+) Transcript_11000:103-933(+)